MQPHMGLFFVCYNQRMKLLATITDQDISDNAQKLAADDFYQRSAARAIVINDKNEVYLLSMSNHGYHKLPGGGIDKGEDIHEALYRELMEEIGCPAKVIQEIGEITELRNEMKLNQKSYCFLARQTGELGETHLEPGEVEEGAQTVVAGAIDEAISILESDKPTTYQGAFIQRRDLVFLREAKTLIQLR
jgi:8-oxo-dGTP pyrophosphatase MutT (NUDIX family)